MGKLAHAKTFKGVLNFKTASKPLKLEAKAVWVFGKGWQFVNNEGVPLEPNQFYTRLHEATHFTVNPQ